jgi:hypothetical protein
MCIVQQIEYSSSLIDSLSFIIKDKQKNRDIDKTKNYLLLFNLSEELLHTSLLFVDNYVY